MYLPILLVLTSVAIAQRPTIDPAILGSIFTTTSKATTASTTTSTTTSTTKPSTISVTSTEPTTALTNKNGVPCQCLPYYLCNVYDVGEGKYDSKYTGWNLLDVRFGDDDDDVNANIKKKNKNKRRCQESVEKCCTEPDIKKPEEIPSNKPNATNLKGCGYRNPKGVQVTLVGGKGDEAEYGEFPWVVILLDSVNNSYVGVGGIIHPQVIITAAHVPVKYTPDTLKIRAGEWDTKTEKELYKHQEREISQFYIHPEFNSKNLANDIALLHLMKPLQLADHINMICLPNQGEVFDNTQNCVASGWGQDRFGSSGRFAVFPKKIELNMVEHSTCNNLLQRTRLGERFQLHSSFVCAGGDEGKDTCTGDGGAPLVCPIGGDRYKLTGLVSWGIGCGQKDVPAVYTSVPSLRSWVDDTMETLGYGSSTYTV